MGLFLLLYCSYVRPFQSYIVHIFSKLPKYLEMNVVHRHELGFSIGAVLNRSDESNNKVKWHDMLQNGTFGEKKKSLVTNNAIHESCASFWRHSDIHHQLLAYKIHECSVWGELLSTVTVWIISTSGCTSVWPSEQNVSNQQTAEWAVKADVTRVVRAFEERCLKDKPATFSEVTIVFIATDHSLVI